MRKSKALILSIILIFTLLISFPAHANMAAPREDDIATGITFERSSELSVIDEVLDIKIEGPKAKIKATYNMKNTSSTPVSTKSMFISPNIEESGTEVLMNDKALEYQNESYYIKYSTKAKVEEWKFILDDTDNKNEYSPRVDTIMFNMDFKANEEAVITVSYIYSLGGYADYDDNAKYGSLKYYLSPAAMWKDYGGITINLELDKDMPVLKESNIDFISLGERKYQFKSDTIPTSELELRVDQSHWQEFITQFNSPYFWASALMIGTPILIILAIITVIVVLAIVIRKKRRKEHKCE